MPGANAQWENVRAVLFDVVTLMLESELFLEGGIMDNEIIIGLVSAVSTIVGVIVGSVSTYYSNKSLKVLEISGEREQESFIEKRKCAVLFLEESNRLIVQAIDKKISSSVALTVLSERLVYIELFYNRETVSAARAIFDGVLNLNSQNKKDDVRYGELRGNFLNLVKNELGINLKKS